MTPMANAMANSRASRQQKMLKQRQILLDRQRNMARIGMGVIARQDLPAPSTTSLQDRVPGWNSFFEASMDKSGCLADMSLIDKEKSRPKITMVRESPRTDEPGSVRNKPILTGLTSTESEVSGGRRKAENALKPAAELDFDFADLEETLVTLQQPVSPLPAGDGQPPPAGSKAGAGWNLQIDPAVEKSYEMDEDTAKKGRLGWRPWNRNGSRSTAGSKQEPALAGPAADEPTPVFGFGQGQSSDRLGTPMEHPQRQRVGGYVANASLTLGKPDEVEVTAMIDLPGASLDDEDMKPVGPGRRPRRAGDWNAPTQVAAIAVNTVLSED